MKTSRYFLLVLFTFFSYACSAWGFYAHKHINRLAIFTLPPEMISFYKKHINEITEMAVAPDRRRYAVKEEACRHYIDLEFYSFQDSLGMSWEEALEKYTEDSLSRHGIVPWHIMRMKYRLTEAFKRGDVNYILKVSAEIGHYIADAHVPLHTTCNYNGQLTNQRGIHGLWESRLPELFFDEYDFLVGRAAYRSNLKKDIWEVIFSSHYAADSVLWMERQLSVEISPDRKYSYEERGTQLIKTYSYTFCSRYHKMLDRMVEERMRASVKFIGDVWYTCWKDAGCPDLNRLNYIPEEKNEKREKISDEHDCSH